MGFKLGKENRKNTYGSGKNRFDKDDTSVPGTPILRKDLAKGVMAEANDDGSIFISNKIEPGSHEERQVINHEMRHSTDMRLGKLAYDDNSVIYNGEIFPRKDINGKDMIEVDGKWKEAGSEGFPWEREANNGNHHGTVWAY